jgi:hypothetical protein
MLVFEIVERAVVSALSSPMVATQRGHIERLLPGPRLRGHRPGHAQAAAPQADLPGRAVGGHRAHTLLRQADGDRFPDRDATLGHALDRYLEVADLEVSTREAHEGYIRRTIRPVLGEAKIRKLGADQPGVG